MVVRESATPIACAFYIWLRHLPGWFCITLYERSTLWLQHVLPENCLIECTKGVAVLQVSYQEESTC